MILRVPDEIGSSLGAALYLASKKDIVEYLEVLIENEYLNRDFSLADKGKKLLRKIKVEEVHEIAIIHLAKRYRDVFKDTNGKSLKPGATGNLKVLTQRLKEFKEEHPEYSDEHILQAIAAYVQSTAPDGYKYLQQAHYTVKKSAADKTAESRLLTFCEEIDPDENFDEPQSFGIDV